MIYYNEFDKNAANWLRELIKEGLIPEGEIDERSIADVDPKDVRGYTQCHFFAGIGGWSKALQLAGVSTDTPLWTGSCPCQPFSSAGSKQGVRDERHLWPTFASLIRECNPPTVFGEQTASKAGRSWFNDVRLDLEAMGYAVGGADLCSAGVGAPHCRQRLFFVGHASSKRWFGRESDSPNQQPEMPWSGSPTAWVDSPNGRALIATQPSLQPVATRVRGDVALLRGSGNAITPQVAAEFIMAAMV